MNYGKAFRIIRAAFAMQQAEFSRRLDIGTSHISLIEAGRRQPSQAVIDKLATAINIPKSLITLLAAEPGDLKEMEETYKIEELAQSLLRLLVSASDETNQQKLPFAAKTRKP
jgi:transcriptional regulator with XRE-family HTH domain